MRNLITGAGALALLLAGCTSTGATEGQKSLDRLSKAINNLADAVEKGKTEMQETLAAYDNVVNNKDGDLLTPFKRFHSGLEKIEKRREEMKKRADEVKAAATPYFAQWKADLEKFSSEDMKKRSQERMEKTKERYQRIHKTAEEARAAYEPLMATLRDHDLYLSNDLNPESASSLQKDAEKAKKNADTVYEIMDRILKGADEYSKAVAARSEPPAKSA
jgi:methyl-accepting chemotaxis protein